MYSTRFEVVMNYYVLNRIFFSLTKSLKKVYSCIYLVVLYSDWCSISNAVGVSENNSYPLRKQHLTFSFSFPFKINIRIDSAHMKNPDEFTRVL